MEQEQAFEEKQERAKAVTEVRLSPEGYPVNERGQRICGARRRNKDGTEGICQSTVLMANGRCRMHGGATPVGIGASQWKHGKYSKVLPPKLLERYEEALDNKDLLTLRDEIALVDALVLDRLERMQKIEGGATDERWLKLKARYERAVEAEKAGDQREMLRNFRAMASLLAGATEAELRTEILELLERRRKLVETERRMLVEMGLMLSVTEAAALVAVITHIIERHVKDRATRAAISKDIRRFVLARNSQPAIPAVVVERTADQ